MRFKRFMRFMRFKRLGVSSDDVGVFNIHQSVGLMFKRFNKFNAFKRLGVIVHMKSHPT
jgi:hypothetical protein